MQKQVLKSSKKLNRLKRLSDFYFQINDKSLPNDRIIIGDKNSIFISPKSYKYCNFCFKGRYDCYVAYNLYSLGQSIDPLNGDESVDLEFINKCIEQSSDDQWSLFAPEFTKFFDLIPYEKCSCYVHKNNDENVVTNFYRDIEKQGDITQFLTNDSFGFISFFNTFDKAGFEDNTLEKILDSNCVSTLITSFPPLSGVVMCGGQDRDKELASLKAVMEFIERYAFYNKVFHSELIRKNNAYNIEKLLNKFDKKCFSDDDIEKLSSAVIWGVDILSKKKALLPINAIYNLDKTSMKISSNGFAAHVNKEKALENATLELIERDAFLRFWMQPESARLLKLDKKIQKQLDEILETLGLIIDNNDLQARILLLPSDIDIPSVLVFITSKNISKPPAILMGSGCAYNINDAIQKAIKEVRVNCLNFITRYQKDPNWIEKDVNYDVKTIEEHMHLYHNPELISQLKFLDYFLNKSDGISYKENDIKNIEQLKDEFKAKGIDWYAIDATPDVFSKYGVVVIRAFSTKLYPLQFGFPMQLDLSQASDLSVARTLPHCFT